MVATKSSGTGTTWAASVLTGLNIKPNATNVTALKIWSKSEWDPSGPDTFNWLDTTLPEPGSVPTNATGVQAFPNYTTGVAALVSVFKEPQYAGLLRALATPGGAQPSSPPTQHTAKVNRAVLTKIYGAIHTSPWCGYPSCATLGTEGGHYPAGLWTYLFGKGATTGGAYETILPGINTTTNPTANPCSWKIGPWCVLSTSEAQKLKGGALLVAGGIGLIFGLSLLAVYGLEGSAAARIGKAVAAGLPGGGKAVGNTPPPPPDADDELFIAQPPATKARVTRESRTTGDLFTDADRSPGMPTPGQRSHTARVNRERKPRASKR